LENTLGRNLTVGGPESVVTMRLDVRSRKGIDIPRGAGGLRLKLHRRGHKLGTIELPAMPDNSWPATVDHAIDHEALVDWVPKYVRRYALRDRRLALQLLRVGTEKRTLRFLWDLAHVRPGRWRARLSAYVGNRAAAILGSGRSTAATASSKDGAREANPPTKRLKAPESAKWEAIFSTIDPWDYGNTYEQTKYDQTLEMLPPQPIRRALEIGCAEGRFTAQLAPRVGTLVAADISTTALGRAQARCEDFHYVTFARLNLWKDALPGKFDLIVCSEVLYFAKDRLQLRRFSRKVAKHLKPGGHFLTAHANVVVDDPTVTGFEWPVGFGSKTIGKTFASLPALEFVRELRTPLYRIQLFRRRSMPARGRLLPREVIEREAAGHAKPLIARAINRGGCVISRAESLNTWTTRELPILMYHSVRREAPAPLARFCTAPERFERQLAFLKRHGYASISVEQWVSALSGEDGIMHGRAVALTFDDAYHDFLVEAWPLLQKYGFSATVFVVTDFVGGKAAWDAAYGHPAQLLSWDEIRMLANEGVSFGTHSASHPYFTRLDTRDLIDEGRRSRARLEAELGREVTVMSYPFGENDIRVRLAMAACGYRCAVTTEPGCSRLGDNPMALPRQEVCGDDDLDAFVAKLGKPERATIDRRIRFRYERWMGRNLL
jgi:peptidoglycan/xylan/chitin deacetylase (PgdA/CDA1 family)/2-polyprenyl-3-methyl-5-hydroxy-6-metoxy-1,4-benzoquinol methylase